MANKTITDLSSIAAGSIDRANDVLELADVSLNQSFKVTPNALFNISGSVVGTTDTQVLTNKTITAPAISSPVLSGTITGTYTLAGTPTFPASVATLTGSQTLTNKVLTSPTINTPTISNASITANAISGFTTPNSGTIYGVSIVLGIIQSAALVNQVNTAAIQNGAVTVNKLSTGASSNTVATSQTTTSVTYTDLATVGPTVTVTIGVNGIALVSIYSGLNNTTAAGYACMSFAVSGANTQAASNSSAIITNQNIDGRFGATFMLTGLTPGSTTFTAKYQIISSGTATFQARQLSVVPL